MISCSSIQWTGYSGLTFIALSSYIVSDAVFSGLGNILKNDGITNDYEREWKEVHHNKCERIIKYFFPFLIEVTSSHTLIEAFHVRMLLKMENEGLRDWHTSPVRLKRKRQKEENE